MNLDDVDELSFRKIVALASCTPGVAHAETPEEALALARLADRLGALTVRAALEEAAMKAQAAIAQATAQLVAQRAQDELAAARSAAEVAAAKAAAELAAEIEESLKTLVAQQDAAVEVYKLKN